MPIKIPEREYRAFGGGYTFEENSDEKQLILRGTPVVFDTPTLICMLAEDTRHQELYRDVKTGLIDQMSFSFTIAEESYDEEKRLRKIIRIKKLYDVSAVTFPAYSQTSISARSYFEEERRKEITQLEQEQRRKKLILRTFT